MKKLITLVILITIAHTFTYGQAVGYQGKKFMVELGYSPVTTLSARYFDYSFDDAYYTDEKDGEVILFKHVPKISIEYVIFNSGSLILRYNPWRLTTNVEYLVAATEEVHLVGAQSKGNMISIGYKSYITATPAPLGSYYGIFITNYGFDMSYVDSEFDNVAAPKEITEFDLDKQSAIGLFGLLGFKNILWDKYTLDVSLEGGLFLSNTVENQTFTGGEFSDAYTMLDFESPHQSNIINTNCFFLVVPTISFGLLAF